MCCTSSRLLCSVALVLSAVGCGGTAVAADEVSPTSNARAQLSGSVTAADSAATQLVRVHRLVPASRAEPQTRRDQLKNLKRQRDAGLHASTLRVEQLRAPDAGGESAAPSGVHYTN